MNEKVEIPITLYAIEHWCHLLFIIIIYIKYCHIRLSINL